MLLELGLLDTTHLTSNPPQPVSPRMVSELKLGLSNRTFLPIVGSNIYNAYVSLQVVFLYGRW